MPVKRVKAVMVPKSRFQNSFLYETREWKDTVREIGKGLKPQEALQVTLSPQTIAQLPLKNASRAFFVALKRYVERHELPIDVTARAREDGETGMDIWVVGRPIHV